MWQLQALLSHQQMVLQVYMLQIIPKIENYAGSNIQRTVAQARQVYPNPQEYQDPAAVSRRLTNTLRSKP